MKRSARIACIIVISIVTLLPLFASAQFFPTLPRPTTQQTCHLQHNLTWLGDKYSNCTPGQDVDIDEYAACCIANTIMNIVMWAFYIIIILSSLFLLVGAFHIISAGGNPDKVNLGKKYITLAVIGATVALLVFILPRILLSIVF